MGLAAASPALAGEDGFALYRAGRYAEAAKAFAQADMAHPREIRYRYNRGVAAMKAGDAKAADAALESALARSEDPEVRYRSAYNLGNAAFEKKDYGKAADYYKKALAEKPGDPDARANFQLALWRAAQAKKEQEGGQCPNPKDGKDGGKKDQGKGGKGKDGGKEGKPGDEKKDGRQGENGGKPQDGEKKPGDQKGSPQDGQQQQAGGQQGQQQQGQQQQGQQQQGQQQQGQQMQGARPRDAKPQDLSGRLAAQGAQNKGGDQGRVRTVDPKRMERLRAAALVDNVREDPALIFRELAGQGGRPGSGKDW